MHVLIVAINHQIQPTRIMSMSTDGSLEAFERDQKERFGELLRAHIRERGIQLVGEEARYGEESIAERVCGQESCRHMNIDMMPEERERRRIPAGYYEDAQLPEAEKTRCNQEREEHMSRVLLAQAGEVASVLVICGRLHSRAIAGQLTLFGHVIEELALRSQSWYVEDWFSPMQNL
jgi:hypothetical protein